jgi:hypothetical protein
VTTEALPNSNRPRLLDYRWVAEKFGLFITPAVAYYLAFTYEASYCKSFAIPPSFIHPDLTTILIYTSVVAGVSFLVVMLIDAWIDVVKAPPIIQPYQHVFRIYGPFLVLVLLVAEVYGTAHWGHWLLVALPIAFGAIVDCLLAFIGDKSQPYLARLKGPAALLSGPGTVWDVARKRLDLELVVFFAAIYIGRLISSALGEAEAFNQRTFLVPSTYPDSVVVRVYGDKILCAGIDLASKKPTQQIYILTAGTDPSLHFDSREIGPLNF